jgi:hypothetical protein
VYTATLLPGCTQTPPAWKQAKYSVGTASGFSRGGGGGKILKLKVPSGQIGSALRVVPLDSLEKDINR